MSQFLLTHVNYGKNVNSGVTVWDFNSGIPIKNIPFENISRNGLSCMPDGFIIGNSENKPLLQSCDMSQNKNSVKKFSVGENINYILPDPDNEFVYLACRNYIQIYQLSSGCFCGRLANAHSDTIGQLCIVESSMHLPKLLISADTNGMIACWSLGSSLYQNNSENIKPIWFTVKISSDQPIIQSYLTSRIFVGTNEGLKILDIRTGDIVRQIAMKQSLSSLLVASGCDMLYMGCDNALVLSAKISEILSNTNEPNFIKRTCFTSVDNAKVDKKITNILSSPDSCSIIVACAGGHIDVLKNDSFLTKLQSFSVIQPEKMGGGDKKTILNSVIFAPCPNWHDNEHKINSDAPSKTICFNRKNINDLDSTFQKRKSKDVSMLRSDKLQSFDIFQDLFYATDFDNTTCNTTQHDTFAIRSGNDESAELKRLREENCQLKSKLVSLESYL